MTRLTDVAGRQSPWHVIVVVPARNEEELLPRCLASILQAQARLPLTVTCDIVVAVDGSDDGTLRMAQDGIGAKGMVVELNVRSVGAARQLGCEVALERYAGPLHRCWLANTDADCEVPSAWLLDQVRMAQRGIAAVAGTVDVDSFEEHMPGVRELFRTSYLVHADGTHPHVHGANLGIRADAYVRAGGWARLATAEDHDLWSRLGTNGCHRVSDAGLQVMTSGRRVGRAPLGFAGALAAHNEVAL